VQPHATLNPRPPIPAAAPPPLPTQDSPPSAFPLPSSHFSYFDPPPDKLQIVFDGLADPDVSLSELAYVFKTTIDALCVWMARPEIAAAMSERLNGIAIRSRFVANSFIPSVIKTLNNVLKDYDAEIENTVPDYSNAKAAETRVRARESTRRTAHLMVVLTRFSPPPSARTQGSGQHEPAAPATTQNALVPLSGLSTQDSGLSPVPTSEFPLPTSRKSEIPLPPLETLTAILTSPPGTPIPPLPPITLPRLNLGVPTLLRAAGAAPTPHSNGSRPCTQSSVLSPVLATQDLGPRTQDLPDLSCTQDFPLRTQDSLPRTQDSHRPKSRSP